jgi:hypothetical protein
LLALDLLSLLGVLQFSVFQLSEAATQRTGELGAGAPQLDEGFVDV